MTQPILIVVADMIFRAKIRETARHLGRAVETASTAAAALEKADAVRPSLVVVDLGDDRVAPFETIRALKTDARLGAPRVVGFFSHVLVEQKRAAEAAGCDVVLPRSAFVKRLAELLADSEPRSAR